MQRELGEQPRACDAVPARMTRDVMGLGVLRAGIRASHVLRADARVRIALLLLALSAPLIFASCTAVGYGAGSIVGSSQRRVIATEDLGHLRRGQYVWLSLDSGEQVSGTVCESPARDSIRVRTRVPSGSAAPGWERVSRERSIPLSAVAEATGRRESYRWIGLGIGIGIDVTIVALIASIDYYDRQ